MRSSWAVAAFRGAVEASTVAAAIALSAGLVRILPWLLDTSVTWRVAAPFARSLLVVALEAAVAVGWPLGWALAGVAFVRSGEGRVMSLLGERPARTVSRLVPQAIAFVALLGGLSFASARESTEPGRIVSELIADGRAACLHASSGETRTYTVPFFDAAWLCGAGVEARLVGQGPGPLASLTFSARDARASGDLGSIDLDDAHIALAAPRVTLHVDALHLRGTAPWGHASNVAPLARALTLSSAVGLSALAAVGLVLSGRDRSRLDAIVIGAAGPIVTLALLRAAERFLGARPAHVGGDCALLLIPPIAVAVPVIFAWLAARLPGLWHAASRNRV